MKQDETVLITIVSDETLVVKWDTYEIPPGGLKLSVWLGPNADLIKHYELSGLSGMRTFGSKELGFNPRTTSHYVAIRQ